LIFAEEWSWLRLLSSRLCVVYKDGIYDCDTTTRVQT